MITVNNAVKFSDRKHPNDMELKGLSTDVKPTVVDGNPVAVNSIFLELDTKDFYYFDGEEWQKVEIEDSSGEYDREIAELTRNVKKRVYYFDNVANMKNARDLQVGEYAITKGYYTANDGGAGEYLIRTKAQADVDDGGSIHFISNNLVAELIVKDNTVNVRQFGAKGDNSNNDTQFIQNSINYASSKNIKLRITNGTYFVSKLVFSSHIHFEGEDFVKTIIKSIANNTETNGIFQILDEGLTNSVFEKFQVHGNKSNNENILNGIYMYTTTSQDYRTVLDTIFISNTTGDGLYVGGSVGGRSIKEPKFNKITITASNGYGINVVSSSDSFYNNIVISNCKKGGFRLSGSGATKISNSKTFWNGKGDETSTYQSVRIPSEAYIITEDQELISGKKYYTKIENTASPYSKVRFSEFKGTSFEEDVTYYELPGTYYERYAGFIISNVSDVSLSNIECQDNYGDGISIENSNNIIISSYMANRNGLLTDTSGNRISYDSLNLVQYFYGIYSKGSKNINIQMLASDTPLNTGKTQRGALFLNSSQEINANIVSADQIQDIYIYMSNTNTLVYHKFDIVLNGRPYVVNYDLSKLVFKNGYSLASNSNQQRSYIRRIGNNIEFRLNLIRTEEDPITHETTQIKTPTGNFNQMIIEPLVAGFRPSQSVLVLAAFTNDLYRITQLVSGNVDYYGNVEFRGNNIQEEYDYAIIQGSYSIRLD